VQNDCVAKLLGIDIGTTGARALLIDEKGKVLRSASAEYPVSAPKPAWSEQNPQDWWNGVCSCLADIGETNPGAIGLSGQMHGAVFLDAKGEVIRPAILWNDQRTEKESAEIDAIVGADRVRKITCNPPLTGFQAPKILWLRKNEPENFSRVRSVLLPKDYIRYRLTGEMHTEVSDASGTALFDVPRRNWSDEMLAALDFDKAWFPQSAESWVATAKTKQSARLAPNISVVGGGGDQAAGAVGTGAVEPGIVSVSLGTSGVVFTALEEPRHDPAGGAHTFCHANGKWHAMGVMLSCGGALRWFRDTFCEGESYDDIACHASKVKAGSEGLSFLPYLSGERSPHNDPRARGAFAGASLSHGKIHFSRAVFEGVSFGLLDGLDLLKRLGAMSKEIRVTGGGAKNAFWVQLLADVFHAPCARLKEDEGPSFGAAILAGVGIGVWQDVRSACKAVVRLEDPVQPSGEDYSEAIERYRKLYGALKGWFKISH
jgi:xylulokinase